MLLLYRLINFMDMNILRFFFLFAVFCSATLTSGSDAEKKVYSLEQVGRMDGSFGLCLSRAPWLVNLRVNLSSQQDGHHHVQASIRVYVLLPTYSQQESDWRLLESKYPIIMTEVDVLPIFTMKLSGTEKLRIQDDPTGILIEIFDEIALRKEIAISEKLVQDVVWKQILQKIQQQDFEENDHYIAYFLRCKPLFSSPKAQELKKYRNRLDERTMLMLALSYDLSENDEKRDALFWYIEAAQRSKNPSKYFSYITMCVFPNKSSDPVWSQYLEKVTLLEDLKNAGYRP